MTRLKLTDTTVSELTRHKKMNVKLGAKDGSSFIYCGKLGELNTEELDTKFINHYERIGKEAERLIAYLNKKPKDYAQYEMELYRKYRRKRASLIKDQEPFDDAELREEFKATEEGYGKWLESIKMRIRGAEHTKENASEKLKNFTPLGGREIVEAYMSIDEIGTVIVIYKGEEEGVAWTTKEYRSLYGK